LTTSTAARRACANRQPGHAAGAIEDDGDVLGGDLAIPDRRSGQRQEEVAVRAVSLWMAAASDQGGSSIW
jgi:hypothetical protein